MANKRKIAVITGSRAEYGLLYWLLKEIQQDTDLELQLLVTGMHLSPEFGLTYQTIQQDGFKIDAKIETLLSSDSQVALAKAIGLGVIGFADHFERLQPDIIVVLGDRFEIFAAVQAALALNIPVAHLHGGELTEGAIDDAIRHCITKMSHLHFVAAEAYRQRVIQLGEQPHNVFNVGALAIDNIQRLTFLTRAELEQSLNFKLGDLNFLVTYHPVTLNPSDSLVALEQLLIALNSFANAKIIITKANADAGGRLINQALENYAAQHKETVLLTTSLGQLRYLSTIQQSDVVIGNSSSGLLEVPFFKKPTVNLGERQRGRLMADSVINCEENTQSIIQAIQIALSSSFKEKLNTIVSPYGVGNASQQIKSRLKQVDLKPLVKKQFYTIPLDI